MLWQWRQASLWVEDLRLALTRGADHGFRSPFFPAKFSHL